MSNWLAQLLKLCTVESCCSLMITFFCKIEEYLMFSALPAPDRERARVWIVHVAVKSGRKMRTKIPIT